MSQTGVELWGVQAQTITINGVTIGFTAAEVQELAKAAAAGAVGPLADKIVELSQRLDVTQGAMRTVLATVGQADVPDERIAEKLAEVVEQTRRHLRIFLSSPGDVAEERRLARELIDGTLRKDPAFADHLQVECVAWDDPEAPAPMLATKAAHASVNEAKPPPSEC